MKEKREKGEQKRNAHSGFHDHKGSGEANGGLRSMLEIHLVVTIAAARTAKIANGMKMREDGRARAECDKSKMCERLASGGGWGWQRVKKGLAKGWRAGSEIGKTDREIA